MRFFVRRMVLVLVLVGVVCIVGFGAWWLYARTVSTSAYQTPAEADNVYVRFDMEGYDDINQNYWIEPGSYENFGTPELPGLFQLAAQQVFGSNMTLATSTRDGVAAMLGKAFSQATSTDADRQDALQILSLILNTLPPQGHDQILSSEAQQNLENTVNNVNPSNNLYSDLGLPQGASSTAVAQAASQQEAALSATTSQTGQQALAQVKQAAQVLTNPTDKTVYDQTGALPTVFSHQIGTHTLYIDVSSVAPTTIAEITAALASSTPTQTNLIIDLRDNIGGDLDFAQEFLALFYGPNEYAFDLYHQGTLDAQRTVGNASPQLANFKEVAVLTDDMTQSTAELVASALKHDRLATIVGTTTRGWGSVEHIYPMQTSIDPNQNYALEIVEYLTVRYDGAPIEGNGVVPDVDVSTSGWQSQLPQYFSSADMIGAIEQAIEQGPSTSTTPAL